MSAMTAPKYPGVGELRAHWIDRRTIVWPRSLGTEGTWFLVGASSGGLAPYGNRVLAADKVVELSPIKHLTWGQRQEWPALADGLPLQVNLSREQTDQFLQGQVAVAHRWRDGTLGVLTGVQLGGVLDDLYRTKQPLGARFDGTNWDVSLWAPTAKSAHLRVYADPHTEVFERLPMERNAKGTWHTCGSSQWRDQYYLFEIEVFAPTTGQVEVNLVTDPYSVSLSVGSTRSTFVDLSDPQFMPDVWRHTPVPAPIRPVDHTIYELHVRDFSISDPSVPEDLQGTYAAFTVAESHGMNHLRKLASAGITTIHLLPTFDIASIPEDRSHQRVPKVPKSGPASADQQQEVGKHAAKDGFNWGYDPMHYGAPEGSYASAANQAGGQRVTEFRRMVGSLHQLGLRVVLDQVYNHTMASGQEEHSVLDKIVPGYYHRLDGNGRVEDSTCCANVATERAMAERLMVDCTRRWARDYHVDGFRFDLMGHHSRANMLAVARALQELNSEVHGIDGSALYLYGEGWNFGEVANNRLFYQATQGQLAGTGIGTFSDRLRDAVQGGHSNRVAQGFATGLFTANSDHHGHATGDQAVRLAQLTDLVRLGMAGNLRSFSFRTSSGFEQRGDHIDYHGQPAGYATQPCEVVGYVDAHDNETLYDLLAIRLPVKTKMADRIRMNTVALATCTLAQTPCLWHAGTDLLRSKSLDRNSYDSGDHFNAIDWTMQQTNFGRGLPPARDNEACWHLMAPLLNNPKLSPQPDDIQQAHAQAMQLLRLRWSSRLMRLGDAALIKERITMPGSGPDAPPGLVCMFIDDRGFDQDVDPDLDGALVVINAAPWTNIQQLPELAGRDLELSPIQLNGCDPVALETNWDAEAGVLSVPARTVAVLVEHQRD